MLKEWLRAWSYRSRQFLAAVLGQVPPDDMREAHAVLGPSLYPVFAELPGQYRHHLLTVYRRAKKMGCRDRDVLMSALLHDAGKYDPASGRYVMLPYRVAIVLLEATSVGRRLLRRLAGAARGPRDWRFPFYLDAHHERLGAAYIARCGAPEEVVRLVREHHKYRGQSEALLALQEADERS